MAKKSNAPWIAQKIINLTGISGWYARPVFRGTLDFETFVREALEDTTFNANEVIGAFKVLQRKMILQLAKGFRIDIGVDFITLYPNCVLTVKDEVNPITGQIIEAKPEMLKTPNLLTRIGCLVANKFKKAFDAEVDWEKVNKAGQSLEQQDDATQGNENVENGEPSSIDPSTGTIDPSTGGNGGGGSTGDGAND